MSTKVTIVAAIAALALCVGAAQANTKGPSKGSTTHDVPVGQSKHPGGANSKAPDYQKTNTYTRHWKVREWKCYYLPTMNDGNLSGLEKKCIKISG